MPFTRWRYISKMMKNVTVAKFELAFTRCRNNLKTVGNLSVKSSLQDIYAEEMYPRPKNRSISFQKRRKCSVFISFEYSHNAVSKICHLEFRFQNLPLAKSGDKKYAVFVLTGSLSVTFFIVFQCASIV